MNNLTQEEELIFLRSQLETQKKMCNYIFNKFNEAVEVVEFYACYSCISKNRYSDKAQEFLKSIEKFTRKDYE